MSDAKQAAERLFGQAYDMPTGMAKHEALERAARAADAADHLPLAVSCRIALVDSSYYLNRYDLMLAPFAWSVAALRRDPSAFDDYEKQSLDWSYKWIPSGLRRDPRFSLDQLRSVVDQLAEHYQRMGHSPQPAHNARTSLAWHIGDEAAYREHFARFLASERDAMSDCEGCVVESQVFHLVHQGRHAEALAHAEPALAADLTCSTQPQGILTTLLPALVELGDLDRARDAHLTAYRLIKPDRTSDYLSDHLEFCATSGNVERGLDVLRDNLHRVHHSTSPWSSMYFAAAAAALLRRVTGPVEFAVPQADGVTTRTCPADELRDSLEATALDLADRFDRRNGTSAVGDRIRAVLAAENTAHVPLAVPVVAPVVEDEPIEVMADPVELAERLCEAFELGDFVTGARLLRSLPPDLDPLLPNGLAAQLEYRRLLIDAWRTPLEQQLERLTAAITRLKEAGETDLANRFGCRLALWQLGTVGLAATTELVERYLADAGSAFTAVVDRLILAELRDYAEEHERAAELIGQARELADAEVPELLPRVRVDAAEHLARRQDLPLALTAVVELLDDGGLPPKVRFDALRIRARLETIAGEGDNAIRTANLLVEEFGAHRGPGAAEAHRLRVTTIEEFGREAQHLAELRDGVAVIRESGNGVEIAKACFALSNGYLQTGRAVEGAETLEEALRFVQAAGAEEELGLQVLFRLGQACGHLGEHEAAVRHLTAALAHVPEGADWQRAMTMDALGNARRHIGQGHSAAEAYREAARCWARVDEAGEAAGSWIEVANVLPDEDVEPSLEALTHADALLPAVADAVQRTRLTARIAALRAFLHSQLEDYPAALEQNAVAELLASELEDTNWQAFLTARGARLLLRSGDAESADLEARRAADLVTDETPGQIVGEIASVLEDSLREQERPIGSDPLLRALMSRLEG
jgi:tetratricopeptide (TPR) repeat protein